MIKTAIYKWILFIGFACSFSSACHAETAPVLQDNAYIPKDTVLNLVLLDPLDSRTNHVNDTVHLRLSEDLTVDNVVIIPKHTILTGTLKKVQKGKFASQSAVIRVKLDDYILPNHRPLPFDQKDIKFKGDLNYTATASSLLVPFSGLFFKGKEIHCPEGTKITYKFKTDLDLGIKKDELALAMKL